MLFGIQVTETCWHLLTQKWDLIKKYKLDVEVEGEEDTPTFHGDRDGHLESIWPPHHDSQTPLRCIIFRLRWILSL